MEITKIEEQKKKKNQFNIYLDDKFAFSLSEQSLVDSGICVGQELTQKEVDQVINKEQKVKALDKAFLWLGIRPRSRFEIKQKLKEKGFDEEVIKKTIKKLKELNYLDDEKFARAWVEDRKLNQPKGRYFIYSELKQKGVNKEIIEKVLDETYSKEEEFELALKLAKKKKAALKNLEPYNLYQKLANYLIQKGFSWGMVKEVWETIEGDCYF